MAFRYFTNVVDTLTGTASADTFVVVFDRYGWDGVPAGYTASATYADGNGNPSPNAGLTGPVNGTATDTEINAGDAIDGGAGNDALWAGGASMSPDPVYSKDFDFRPVSITSVEELWFSYMIMPMPGSARFNSSQFGAGMSNTMTVRGAWGGTDIIVDLVPGATTFSAEGWNFANPVSTGAANLVDPTGYRASMVVNGVTWYNVPSGVSAYSWGPYIYKTYNVEVGYGVAGDDMGGDFFHEDRVLLNGSTGADTITGSVMYDIISAGDGDDVVNAGHGALDVQGGDDVDGGAGSDTLVFTKNFADYTFSKAGDVITFSEVSGANPTTFAYTAAYNSVDSRNFELFQFADGVKTLADLGYGGDTTPPSVSISTTLVTDSGTTGTIASGGVTKDTTLGLSGTAGDDVGVASVEIFDGATSLGLASLSGGNWTFTTAALSEGAHSLTAVASDAAGNTTPSSAVTVTIDATAPTVGITSTGGLTNDATQTVTGTGEAGASVMLMDGMTSLGTTTVGAGGAWSIDVTLSEGAHSLLAHATDAAGNMGMSTAVGYTLDTVAPSVGITSTGGNVTDPNQTVSGTGEAGTTVGVYDGATLLNTATVASDGTWSVSVTLSGEGTHSLTAQDTDAAGNIATSGAVIYNLGAADTTPPLLTITSLGGQTNDTTPTVTGTISVADAGLAVAIYEGATALGTATVNPDGTWTANVTLSGEGAHALTAQATDAAGNLGTSPAVTYTLDTIAPAVGISSTGGPTNDATQTVTGTGEAGASVELMDGASSVGVTTVAGDGTWSINVDFGATQGLHSLMAHATDAAGNMGMSAAVGYTLDTVAPSVVITSTGGNVTDPNQTVSGTGEAGTTVGVYDGVNLLNTAIVLGDGTWSVSVTLSGEGTHSLTAQDTDAAGNIATSGAVIYNLGAADVTPPAPPTITTLSAGGINPLDPIWVVAGQAEAGSTVNVYAVGDPIPVGTGTADASGDYSVETTADHHGLNVFYSTATDAAANVSAASLLYYQGGHHGDTIALTDPTALAGISRIDGDEDVDTLAFTSASNVVDGDFAKVTGVETLALTGASSAEIGSDAAFAGINGVVTGDGATSILNSVVERLVTVDGSALGAGATLALSGAGDFSAVGSAANNSITSGSGNDSVAGGAGNDTINAGAGSDTAVFSGNLANYTITDIGGGQLRITDNVGSDGEDVVSSVEYLQFADGAVPSSNYADVTPPAVPVIADWDNTTAPVINGANPLWKISGTAEPGAIIKLYQTTVAADGAIGTRTQLATYTQATVADPNVPGSTNTVAAGLTYVIADASGNWSFQTNLSEHGNRRVSATATDAAGNVSGFTLVDQQGGHHSTVDIFANPAAFAAFSRIDGFHQDAANGDVLSFTDADVTVTDADFAKVTDYESLKFAGSAMVTLGAQALAAGIGGEITPALGNGKIITGTGNTSITDSNAHTLNVDAALLAAGSTLTLAGAANFAAAGGAIGDLIDASAATGANALNGGDGDDAFKGGAGADTMDGGAGSDTADYSGISNAISVRLQAVKANPDMDGHGVPGDYTIGGASTVVVTGGTNDTLYGVENVTGGSGNDSLYGDGAVNVLHGGLGNDNLVANRQVYIQAGDVFDGGDGTDRLWAGGIISMTDIDYGMMNPVSNLDFSAATLQNLEEFSFNYMGMLMPGTATFSSSQFGAGLMSNNLTVYGAWGDNDITVNLTSGDSTFDASGWTFPTGANTSGATDYVWGHYIYNGATTMMVYNGQDVGGTDTIHLNGSAGANVITGTMVDDIIVGGGGNDALSGGAGADLIDASASIGVNTLNGNDGDDVFKGGAGADTMDGGAGSDTADYTGVTNNLTVRLQAVKANPDATGHGIPGDYTVGGVSTVVVTGGTNDTLYGVENVTGGSGADMLMGDGAVNVLKGGLGNDGLAANRQVYIQAGDVFDGGDGVDTLWAGKTMTDIDYGSDPVSYLDFSAATLQNIEQFAFNYMPMPMPGTATFSSSQFGAGLMSNNLAVYGAWGDNDITVNLTSGNSSFDASGWTFPTGAHTMGMNSYVWGRYTLATDLGMGKAGMEVGGNDTIHLMGSSGDNSIGGTSVDDILVGAGGNDAIDGNSGVDTAVFSGAWSDYSISEAGGVYTIVDNRGGSPDGTDTVTDVELFQFSNATYTAAQLLSGDLTAPTVTITSAGGLTNQPSQTVTGAGEVGTTVTVKDGAVILGTAIVAPDGSWSLTVTLSGEGGHTLMATDVDAVGNVGTSAPVAYTLDTTAPAVTIIGSGGLTNDATQTVTGTGEAGTTVTVLDGATTLGATTVDASGAWTFDATLTGEGLHSLTATDVDAAGNMGASAALMFTLDTVAPTVAITSAGGLTNDVTQTVSGTGEVGATVVVMDGMNSLGSATVAGDGAWSVDVTLSGEGAHSLMAHATDAAGNMGMSGALDFTVDTTAPTVSLVTIPPETTTDTSATFTWAAGNPLDVATYRYSTDNGATWTPTTGASVTLTGLSLGAHSFQVEAIDAAGNTSAIASDNWTIQPISTVDVTVNPFSGDNFVNGAERLVGAPVTGSYSGFSGGGAVSYAIVDSNGVTKASGSTGVSGASGNFSILVPTNTVKSLLDGTYTLNVTGTDSASNTDTATGSFMVDRLGPSVTLTSQPPELTNQTTATFTWTAADGSGSGAATYRYSTNGGSTWTTTSDTSVTLTGLSAGNRSFKVRAIDYAGNVGSAVTDTWKIDLTPPAKPVITGTSDGPPTSNPTWIVEGTAEKGSTVTIYRLVSGVPTVVGTGVANASTGAFAIGTTANQHGARILYAVATDVAGNASAPSLLYYQGGHHADVITLNSALDFGNISLIDGFEDNDTLKFSSSTAVIDPMFKKVTDIENLELTGASGAILGAKAAAAGITNVITGNGNTAIWETVSGASLSVDAGALAGSTLGLAGSAHYTVNNLTGDLNAILVGSSGSVSATVIGDGHNVVGSSGADSFTAAGATTFAGGGGADVFSVAGHTGADVFVYTSKSQSQNTSGGRDLITGFNAATDTLDLAWVAGVDDVQGALASTSTKIGAHDVAWIYDASVDQTHVFANTGSSQLSQSSTSLMRVDLAGNLSSSLGAGNFQFDAA